MRFRTRFDRSLLIGMPLVAVSTCITLPLLRFLARGDHPAQLDRKGFGLGL